MGVPSPGREHSRYLAWGFGTARADADAEDADDDEEDDEEEERDGEEEDEVDEQEDETRSPCVARNQFTI
jgi:hypothetical protein